MSTIVPLDVIPVPLEPANTVELLPGGGAIVGLFALAFIAAIAFGVWRMIVVNEASKQLGLTDEQRFLAVTDEQAGAAIVTGSIISNAVTGSSAGTAVTDGTGDLASRLDALQAARDRGLITADEFAQTRQRMLDEA